MRVLVLSPVRLIREGLGIILNQRLQGAAVLVAEAGATAVTAFRTFAPTLILLDVADADSLRTASQLAAETPATPILGFAASEHDHDVIAYAEAGIAGFVPKDASTDDLFDAIARISRGELLCSPRIAGTIFRRLAILAGARPVKTAAAALTAREWEIARRIDSGLSNKEIAHQLRLSVSTVKNHVHRILEKLQVNRRGEAAARLRRWDGHVPAESAGRRYQEMGSP